MVGSDLCVFTCDYSFPPADCSLLRNSCARVGIELHMYGHGQPWPGFPLAKIRGARQFLATRREDYALFVDSTDTFILSTATAILESFAQLDTNILVSGEKNCWPLSDFALRYPHPGAQDDPGTPWRFVNSGGWMGLRTALIEALGEMDSIFVSLARQGGFRSNCDQSCWVEWVLSNHRHDIYSYVDARCQIFQCMWRTTEMLDSGLNSVTGTKPSVWHFNGGAEVKEGMRTWYERLTS